MALIQVCIRRTTIESAVVVVDAADEDKAHEQIIADFLENGDDDRFDWHKEVTAPGGELGVRYDFLWSRPVTAHHAAAALASARGQNA